MVRTEQMHNTRRRAIDAARRLFLERGYAGTTIAAVAEEAEISPETIYSSLKGKSGLLEGVIEAAIMGPEGAVSEQQRWLESVARLPSPRQRLRGWVDASCHTLARTSPIHAVIRAAADREPFAVALRERLLQRRLAQVTALAADFLHGALRPGISGEDAGHRYAALLSPEMYHLCTADLGWTPQRFQTWATQLLETDLLDESTDAEQR
ncbi:TetR/AcrR family transcriptional regulator [Actinomycetospora sp. CA-053990]|uniref:TetR/AcrR family transcriptional regulator n=1 Tax=Actinomycetospora sp. CA-053990 TaxID=3239891 RepID=UPI003D93DD9F